jgi:hypothetical protein
MNPLEILKDKLKLKPKVHEYEQVIIKMKENNYVKNDYQENIFKPTINITDKRNQGYNPTNLLNRLKNQHISKVIEKFPLEKEELVKAPIINEVNKKPKIKKIKKQLILVEDEDDNKIDKEELEKDNIVNEEKGEILEEIIEIEPKSKKRRTSKKEKGIVELGNETMVQIGDTIIAKRLPNNPPNINIKVSSYFMNNREIFINFINGLFEPYKDDLLNENKALSCDDLGKDGGEVNLLTHQKIVRDYINLYTPYRGLLLYHGLGAGKTATSISIAEGFKSSSKVIIMTPASLKRNYLEEIKKYGDLLYRKNQFWEWISIQDNSNIDLIYNLSRILGISKEYIKRKQGAWLVNITKPSNYNELSSSDKKNLDEQLDEMIQNKYTFINYNGLRRDKFKQLTNNFENNIFDNAVVIIDEAHNLISRIVNKLNKIKKFAETPRGPKSILPISLSLQMYEFLLRADNCRIILLSGTPIINYPNEIGILFNILRGYIKSWQLSLTTDSSKKLTKETLLDMFAKEKILDYIDYSPTSKILTITRNPYGFDNKITEKSGYKGVTNEIKERKDESGKVIEGERGSISDEDFIKRIVKILKKNDIQAISKGTHFDVNTALPDTLDEFINLFIDKEKGVITNIEKFKKRIIGLTSYFKSAQEELLPRYDKITDFNVVKIPMSNYQFKIYEEARILERKMEKPKKSPPKVDKDGIFIDPSSTYRIFSRLFCNFVMPNRPTPSSIKNENIAKGWADPIHYKDGKVINEEGNPDEELTKNEKIKWIKLLKKTKNQEEKLEGDIDLDDEEDAELEADDILEKMGDQQYKKAIQDALQYLKVNSQQFLTPEGLQTYSPKFLHILENIQDPDHIGLHLIYSQFRSMEGIGIFTLVLETNGFAEFKLKKVGDSWEINIKEEDIGKPTFALYTGTEDAEEREIIRNIYNGSWNYIPTQIANKLKQISNNNNIGEIIKVLMITAAGSEGINLRNTRYVHLMEPYWHPVRLEQVIGRARRICSHKELPIELQTVEVFLYLMTFSAEQLNSDEAIELKVKDLSKRKPVIPLTSDEALFEISNIKEELTTQLLKGIKETSIDCAIYSKANNKENLKCLSFGQPSVNKFSYNPNISQDENDTIVALNKITIQWEGSVFKFNGKQMILREETKDVYDYDSYMQALKVPGIVPILLGKLQKKDGKYIIIKNSI